jgi:hypothetical protein
VEAPAPAPTAEEPAVTASLAAPAPPTRPPGAAALQAAGTRGSLRTNAEAATDCLPDELRGVLADIAARFGDVTIVSTHQLNTVNHSSGSIREKLHHDCKAVDIRPQRERIDEIKAYLRGRREIAGLESYRNGIIHIDVSSGRVAAKRTRAATAQSGPGPAAQPQTAGPSAGTAQPR